METYVSSLAKGNKESKDAAAVAQSKINAAIKQLHNVIDSFEEDKTEQRNLLGEIINNRLTVRQTDELIKEKCSECVYKKICRGLYSVSGRNIYTGEEK